MLFKVGYCGWFSVLLAVALRVVRDRRPVAEVANELKLENERPRLRQRRVALFWRDAVWAYIWLFSISVTVVMIIMVIGSFDMAKPVWYWLLQAPPVLIMGGAFSAMYMNQRTVTKQIPLQLRPTVAAYAVGLCGCAFFMMLLWAGQ
jgi:hypothetical protein